MNAPQHDAVPLDSNCALNARYVLCRKFRDEIYPFMLGQRFGSIAEIMQCRDRYLAQRCNGYPECTFNFPVDFDEGFQCWVVNEPQSDCTTYKHSCAKPAQGGVCSVPSTPPPPPGTICHILLLVRNEHLHTGSFTSLNRELQDYFKYMGFGYEIEICKI